MEDLLDPYKNPLTFAAPFFLLSIAIELAALRWLDPGPNVGSAEGPKLKGYLAKDARTSILMGLGSIIFLTLFKIGTFFVFVAVSVYLAPWHLHTGTWWYWVLLMLTLDLAFYLHHRFVHRVRIGWAAHQAHHSSEYFNFGTALRQKWNPWTEALFWLPLPLLGFAPWTLYVAFSFNLIYQFFTHTEVIGKMWWPIEFIMNTPSHHRVHHGSDAIYLDKNFAGIFIIWDRMFGSFQPEIYRPTYGLTTQVDTYNLLSLQYGDYAQMVRDVRGAATLRDKLGYVLGPPGWQPHS